MPRAHRTGIKPASVRSPTTSGSTTTIITGSTRTLNWKEPINYPESGQVTLGFYLEECLAVTARGSGGWNSGGVGDHFSRYSASRSSAF